MPKKELKGSSGLFANMDNAKKIIDNENQLSNVEPTNIENSNLELNSKQDIEQDLNIDSNLEQNTGLKFKSKNKRNSKTFYLKAETIALIQSLSKKYTKLNKIKISESDVLEELISIAIKSIGE